MALSVCNSQTNEQGRALAEHGTALFPAACFHDRLAEQSVAWHWHDDLEAIVIIKGRTVISTGAEKYIAEAGQGFFINAGTLHALRDEADSACELHSVVFHPRLVGGSAESVFWQSYVQPLLDDNSLKQLWLDFSQPWHRDAIDAVLEAWRHCVDEEPGYQFQVRNALSRLVFLLTSGRSANCKPPSEKALRDSTRIKQMLQYVREHLAEELTTRQIAQSASISESECLRCFRATIGSTPIHYTKQLRVQRAAELLLSTEDKIVDIGLQCGFQEMSYFSKAFREHHGCSPSDYRKQHMGAR